MAIKFILSGKGPFTITIDSKKGGVVEGIKN